MTTLPHRSPPTPMRVSLRRLGPSVAAIAVAMLLAACTNSADAPRPTFDVSPAEDTARATRGSASVQAALHLTVSRAAGHEEEIVVTAENLPSGVTADPLTIPADADTAELALQVEPDAALGVHAIDVVGSDGSTTSSSPAELLVKDRAGTLDATFGSDGWVVHDFGPTIASMVQSAVALDDGRILVTGQTKDHNGTPDDTSDDTTSLFLARFLEDGSVDESFGASGFVVQERNGVTNSGAIAVGDDRIVRVFSVWTAGQSDFHAVAYHADGRIDTSFGDSGEVSIGIGAEDIVQDVLLTPAGEIVISGYADGPTDDDMALVRLHADGTPDSGFGGGDGVQLVDFGGTDRAFTLERMADGRMVLAGFTDVGGDADFAVARIEPDGSLDTSFGVGGRLAHDFGYGSDYANAIVVLQGDRLLVGGEADTATEPDFALIALESDGSFDATFGSGGTVLTDFEGGWDALAGLALQEDGRIVATGTANIFAPEQAAAVARYDADGALDTSFSFDGKTLVRHSSGSEYIRDLVLARHDRIVLFGQADGELGLVRYWR